MNQRPSLISFAAAVGLVVLSATSRNACVAATPLLGNSFGTFDDGGVLRDATLYDVDPATGAETNPRPLGINGLAGITIGPGGFLYGLTTTPQRLPSAFGNTLVRIDPVTGITTVVGPTGLANIGEGDIEYNPATGLLYGLYEYVSSPSFQTNLFTLNPATGQATVGPNLGLLDPSAMAFSPAGKLYVLNHGSGGQAENILEVDPVTGALLSGADLTGALGPAVGLDFEPATGTLYVADGGGVGGQFGSNALYTLDPSTGALTLVGGVGPLTHDGGLAGLTFVPEPASLSLLAVGGLALLRRLCIN
jgi:hypothetical protein